MWFATVEIVRPEAIGCTKDLTIIPFLKVLDQDLLLLLWFEPNDSDVEVFLGDIDDSIDIMGLFFEELSDGVE